MYCLFVFIYIDRIIFVGNPERKRPFGIPRLRWKTNIKVPLKEIGYESKGLFI
jgi:hypothetical protein